MNILPYECSMYFSNLLEKDIKISNIKAQILDIGKYFQNLYHVSSSKVREISTKKLELPSDVTKNCMLDTMQFYISNLKP